MSKHKEKLGELWSEAQAAWSGYKLKKTGTGHDYKAGPIFGSGKEFYVEVKTGRHARLSKHQRKAKKKLGNRYVVHKPKPYFGFKGIKRS